MKYMGFQISEDGKTEWRNNGGIIERRFLYSSSNDWEIVAEDGELPHTARELKKYCEEYGYGYESQNG